MEADLVRRARDGDRLAFEQLVHRHVDSMYRTALAVLGRDADAQDAVQEAFVSAWRQLPSLRDVDRFDAWLGRIGLNACRMALRGRRVREVRVVALEAGDGYVASAAEAVVPDRLAAADSFDRAFERLSIDERSLLVMHHLEELPLTSIADRLGVPVGTVKSRLHAARTALERALAAEERGPER